MVYTVNSLQGVNLKSAHEGPANPAAISHAADFLVVGPTARYCNLTVSNKKAKIVFFYNLGAEND